MDYLADIWSWEEEEDTDEEKGKSTRKKKRNCKDVEDLEELGEKLYLGAQYWLWS